MKQRKSGLPGHILKAFRSVDHFLPVVDLIVELVDARMPNGSRLKDFVKRLDKKSIVTLGKSDLADEAQTRKWVSRYNSEGLSCIDLDARSKSSVKRLAALIKKIAFSSEVGAPMRKARRVMIIGIPNVGKSTLINSLAGRKAARAANIPGVTRDIQWIKLPGQLELLDLPGILDFSLLRRGDILRLINTFPGRDEDCYSQAQKLCEIMIYSGNEKFLPGFIEADRKFDAFLDGYASRMNFMAKGAIPDIHRAASDLIRRFQSGGFGRITLERADEDFSDLFASPLNEEESHESDD